MRQKGLVFHGALLLVSAGVAWWAWHDVTPALQEGTGPVLADIEQKDIEEISYRWPDGSLTATPQQDGAEVSWLIALDEKVQEKPAPAPKTDADAGPTADAGPPAVAPATVTTVSSRFPAGRQLVRSIEKLAPLQARRSLGKVEAERLPKMGLGEPERKLVVRAHGKAWSFDVGEATYGDQGRYARLEGSDEVLLLESAAIRGFEGNAVRLMEARIVPVALDDVTGFAVAVGAREAAFDQMERDQPKLRHFVVRGNKEARSEEAQGLLATLRGLRAKEYVDAKLLVGQTPIGTLRIEREKAPPVDVGVFESTSGESYYVQAGPWIGEVPSSRGKNLVDDMTAALPVQ